MALNCTARALVIAQVRTFRSSGSFNVHNTSFFNSFASAKAAALKQRRFTTAIVASAAEGEVAGECLQSTPRGSLNSLHLYINLCSEPSVFF